MTLSAKCILLCALLLPLSVQASGFPEFFSSVPGFALWRTDGERNVPLTMLNYGEYALYCNGRNKVYILEAGNKAYTCKLSMWVELDEKGQQIEVVMDQRSPELQKRLRQALARAKKYDPQNMDNHPWDYHFKLEFPNLPRQEYGAYLTVSKQAFSAPSWESRALSPAEIAQLKPLVMARKQSLKCKGRAAPCTMIFGVSEKKLKTMVAKWVKPQGFYVYVSNGEHSLAMVPVWHEVGQGSVITSAIFVKKEGEWRFHTSAQECLVHSRLDLNGDGMPEFLMQECDPGEGEGRAYYQIWPKPKVLLGYYLS